MSVTSSSSIYKTQLQFYRALETVRQLPLVTKNGLEPSAADKLSLYALYKQASQGDCNIPRPSSRQVVEYAKWKAWDRMRGMSPVEAQKLYVNGIIELLVEFISRYPNHEQRPAFEESLSYLQMADDSEQQRETAALVDFEKEQDERLTQIDPQQLVLQSPPPFSLNGTRNTSRYAPPAETSPSLITATSTTTTQQDYYPMTPEIYPSSSSVVNNKKNIYYSMQPDSSQPKPAIGSETVLEKLQMDVAALSEQIDRLRRAMTEKEARRGGRCRRWLWLLLKALLKQILVNSFLFTLVFVILWYRRSPYADAMLAYLKPRIQRAMRQVLGRVVLWRVTV